MDMNIYIHLAASDSMHEQKGTCAQTLDPSSRQSVLETGQQSVTFLHRSVCLSVCCYTCLAASMLAVWELQTQFGIFKDD